MNYQGWIKPKYDAKLTTMPPPPREYPITENGFEDFHDNEVNDIATAMVRTSF